MSSSKTFWMAEQAFVKDTYEKKKERGIDIFLALHTTKCTGVSKIDKFILMQF